MPLQETFRSPKSVLHSFKPNIRPYNIRLQDRSVLASCQHALYFGSSLDVPTTARAAFPGGGVRGVAEALKLRAGGVAEARLGAR